MKLLISSSVTSVINSIKATEDLLPDLKKYGYSYNFPFSIPIQNFRSNELKKIIANDLVQKNFNKKVAHFINMWNQINTEILSKLENLIIEKKADNARIFTCHLTIYGTDGYYDIPDSVYVNIGSKRSESFYIETMIHELLHIIMETNKEFKNMNFDDKEEYIDLLFLKMFGNRFPNYKVQN